MSATTSPVLIIGGGIAGMAAAHTVAEAGRPFRLLEAAPQLGGVIATHKEGPYRLEMGPFSFLPSAECVPRLLTAWGLQDQIIEADPTTAGNRYVFAKGAIHRVPMSPKAFLTSHLFSWWDKCRLLWEPFAKGPPGTDESIAAFVRRRAGRGFLDNLIQPFVSGVVAGDTECLSVASLFPQFVTFEKEYGSLLKAFRRRPSGNSRGTLYSLQQGMVSLPETFAVRHSVAVETDARVTAIGRRNGAFAVTWQRNGNTTTETAPDLIVATPAYCTAAFIRGLSPELADALDQIVYAPIMMVHTVYKRSQLTQSLNGFGFLAARDSTPPLLGSIWASAIFPNRAPADEILLTWFLGGALYPEVMAWDDARVLRTIEAFTSAHLGITGGAHRHWVRRYSHAIPQYEIGHAKRAQRIADAATAVGPLYITGNFLTGVSVEESAKAGIRTARQLLSHA